MDVEPQAQVAPEVTPERKEIESLLTQLFDLVPRLALKTIVCDCDRKNNCEVYQKSIELAKLVDRMTDLRDKIPTMGVPSGTSGRTSSG